MPASVTTFTIHGVSSREVTVEVDVKERSLSAFTIVGLPDRAVRESRERVRAAVKNSEFDFPNGRITANLAPADVHKAGPAFDLALAVGILVATDQIPAEAIAGHAICGELSLSGGLRPVRGLLGMAIGARRAGLRRLIVPADGAEEAAIVDHVEVLAVPDLDRLAAMLRGEWEPPRIERTLPKAAPAHPDDLDLKDVRGQHDAKRALEIAAAGGHNLLMIGPPGSGKTMLARRLPGLLPPPTFEEAIEITQIRSVAGLGGRLVAERPFRAPHHTLSAAGLVGGGPHPKPGEITLAHRGVLFLDELAEFPRDALEALRQPLEEGRIQVTRANASVRFPADFMLVAAANECPCARPSGECRCTEIDRRRYARKLSGPLLDRIDLVCHVPPAAPLELVSDGDAAAGSAAVRELVLAARERQRRRLVGSAAVCNGDMDGRMTRRHARLDNPARDLLLEGHRRMTLTGRGHDRVLRIARTISDLAGSDTIQPDHVAEALGYRLGGLDALAA
ncbi:MAG: YifB family Mg chelatase-like AAA ATPase [Thermoleophilaceae bacterium]